MSSKIKGTGIRRPYKIRKSWDDTRSQIASYAYLDNAIQKLLQINDKSYKIYQDGNVMYELINDISKYDSYNNDKLYIKSYESNTIKIPEPKLSILRRIINKLFNK